MGIHEEALIQTSFCEETLMLVNNPKISIVIVVRNAKATIDRAILSIINQDYKNYELVITDGQSTDGTTEIIKKYTQNITHFVSEKDLGIYDAMNKSIKNCSGDWIYFLGADDAFHNQHVLSAIFSTSHHASDIIYGNAYYTHRKTIRFGKMNRYMMGKHNMNHQTIFYPKNVFIEYTYNIKYKIVADYYLNLQLYFRSNFSFKFLNLVVVDFNDLGTSGIMEDHLFNADKESIIKKLFPADVYVFYKVRQLFIVCRDKFSN